MARMVRPMGVRESAGDELEDVKASARVGVVLANSKTTKGIRE